MNLCLSLSILSTSVFSRILLLEYWYLMPTPFEYVNFLNIIIQNVLLRLNETCGDTKCWLMQIWMVVVIQKTTPFIWAIFFQSWFDLWIVSLVNYAARYFALPELFRGSILRGPEPSPIHVSFEDAGGLFFVGPDKTIEVDQLLLDCILLRLPFTHF